MVVQTTEVMTSKEMRKAMMQARRSARFVAALIEQVRKNELSEVLSLSEGLRAAKQTEDWCDEYIYILDNRSKDDA